MWERENQDAKTESPTEKLNTKLNSGPGTKLDMVTALTILINHQWY